jgi:hypothetical protein
MTELGSEGAAYTLPLALHALCLGKNADAAVMESLRVRLWVTVPVRL